MPRFFFHVEDGASPPDGEGADLPDLAMAREYAIGLADVITKDHEMATAVAPWRILIQDEAGDTLDIVAAEGKPIPRDQH